MNEMDLDTIGLAHQTDKASVHHDFLQLYERFLRSLRYEAINLLEIGVFGGGSLRTWADYFPRATILGIDINPDSLQHQSARIKVEVVDQSNIEQLHDLGMRHGPFDILIDDGSHVWDHQITTLRTMLPFVKKGGFYIVEDLDTSYGSYEPNYRGIATESAASYLHRVAAALVGDTAIDIASEPDAFIRSFARRLDYIVFAKRTSIVRRK